MNFIYLFTFVKPNGRVKLTLKYIMSCFINFILHYYIGSKSVCSIAGESLFVTLFGHFSADGSTCGFSFTLVRRIKVVEITRFCNYLIRSSVAPKRI